MSERQKLLDAARTAVNLLDAAHSAVDLLTTVLGTEEENGCHDNLTEQHCDVTDLPQTSSKSTSEVWQTQISEGRGPMRGTSMLRIKDDTKPHSQNTAPSNMHRTLFAETKEANKDNGSKSEEETKMTELEQKLTEEKAKLTAQVADYTDKYKRALAETENVRMRFTKQLTDSKIYSISGFCKDLLEVADILGKATTSVPKDAVSGADANIHLKNLYEGLVMTETQLQKVFAKNKLEVINPVNNEKFDPHVHEALFQVPAPDKEPGTVAVVEKLGYKLHERTLRPALVGVTKAI